ncbi:M23 family metallopeptidase [Paenibacillus rhizovicinus]|uniref:M23 family metallopeptidase n=1 Tax=Paenibacillus rhizovicinus TaxID=2704463 RepID=A0A6C0P614_9BACL|nr:M23 family metallopeptidase [Paenibacillus rhizovicinus]QHW34024.1 M23 family metallopeptidase [Paenibacillus rhizovicinus]
MVKEIVIHPVYDHAYYCFEHPEGQLTSLGDAVGVDCVIHKFVDGWMRAYKGDGTQNEDWYGWGADVLAPFDGIVADIYVNPTTNKPGHFEQSRASAIHFTHNCDETHVLYAHIMDVCVEKGEQVKAGQVVAKVGNNGFSRHPHLHIGAWRNNVPLQVRFDLSLMGKQFSAYGEGRYYK